MQHAHQKGIIHRDIKPSNVLVTLHDGRPVPKVIDFGVAKAIGPAADRADDVHAASRRCVGTPLYMSPEQAELSELDVDTRSDIYSLGVLLYELLTGTTPFAQAAACRPPSTRCCAIIREEEPPKPSTRLSDDQRDDCHQSRRSATPEPLQAAAGRPRRAGLDRDEGAGEGPQRTVCVRDRFCAPTSNIGCAMNRVSVHAPDPAYLLRIWLRRNLRSTGWAITLGVIWGIVRRCHLLACHAQSLGIFPSGCGAQSICSG